MAKSNPSPDLIFLDIQLADGLSFSIFEKVEVKSPVIFTTAYDEFALKAFELNSIDYLLKPVKKEELQQSLQKYRSVKDFFSSDELKLKMYDLLNQMKNETKNYKDRFLVNKGDSLIPVTTSDIAYFYTEEKAVFLVKSDNQRFFVNYSLDELEGLLDPASYYRVNRQFIINFNAIAKVNQYYNYKLKIELNPSIDKEIIISKANVSEFKNWLDR